VQFYSHNSVAVLAFPAGAGYPRLTRAILDELEQHLTTLRREALFHGLVIATGTESFATGADLEEVSRLEGVSAWEFALRGQRVLAQIERFPAPVVAAISGYCLGGGLDLALACHARVATYDSSFGHPAATLGLLTGWGGTQRLPRLVSKAAALEVFMTGERLPATQALTLGLVDELVSSPELVEAAARRAERLWASGRWPGADVPRAPAERGGAGP
jgi:enoyl-CoA hydratase/carnithine racemase